LKTALALTVFASVTAPAGLILIRVMVVPIFRASLAARGYAGATNVITVGTSFPATLED
jgi:hypothetical protein